MTAPLFAFGLGTGTRGTRGNWLEVFYPAPLRDADAAIAAAIAATVGGDADDLFDETMAAQLSAFEVPGALERIVHHPSGDIPGAAFAGFRAGDLLLHGWDLARSTGGDEALPADLAEVIHGFYLPTVDRARTFGIFADSATVVTDDEPIARRLLVLTGRA